MASATVLLPVPLSPRRIRLDAFPAVSVKSKLRGRGAPLKPDNVTFLSFVMVTPQIPRGESASVWATSFQSWSEWCRSAEDRHIAVATSLEGKGGGPDGCAPVVQRRGGRQTEASIGSPNPATRVRDLRLAARFLRSPRLDAALGINNQIDLHPDSKGSSSSARRRPGAKWQGDREHQGQHTRFTVALASEFVDFKESRL